MELSITLEIDFSRKKKYLIIKYAIKIFFANGRFSGSCHVYMHKLLEQQRHAASNFILIVFTKTLFFLKIY